MSYRNSFAVLDSEIEISPYRLHGQQTYDHSGHIRGVFIIITTASDTALVKWVNLKLGHKKIIIDCGDRTWLTYKPLVEDSILALTKEKR